MNPLRILSYNIRGGLGMDGRRDTGRITQVVSALEPDIVCLQEVHRRLPWSGWIDQPRRLRQGLGLPVVFQANLRFFFGGYGVAIVTRYPIRKVRRHFLPSVGEQRGALEVEMGTPEGPLTVFCTHWGLKREERERQADALAKTVLIATAPLIVCGDLNDFPDSDCVQTLRRRAGLRDWGGEASSPTYPADAPRSRIDFILGSDGLVSKRVSVVPTHASDHLPVVADFRLGD